MFGLKRDYETLVYRNKQRSKRINSMYDIFDERLTIIINNSNFRILVFTLLFTALTLILTMIGLYFSSEVVDSVKSLFENA